MGASKCTVSTRAAVTLASSRCRSHPLLPAIILSRTHTHSSAQELFLDKGQAHVLPAQAEPARVARRARILLGCGAERPAGADGERAGAPLASVRRREMEFKEIERARVSQLFSSPSPHVTCCLARRRGALICNLTMARCMLFTWTSGKLNMRPGTRWRESGKNTAQFSPS